MDASCRGVFPCLSPGHFPLPLTEASVTQRKSYELPARRSMELGPEAVYDLRTSTCATTTTDDTEWRQRVTITTGGKWDAHMRPAGGFSTAQPGAGDKKNSEEGTISRAARLQRIGPEWCPVIS